MQFRSFSHSSIYCFTFGGKNSTLDGVETEVLGSFLELAPRVLLSPNSSDIEVFLLADLVFAGL